MNTNEQFEAATGSASEKNSVAEKMLPDVFPNLSTLVENTSMTESSAKWMVEPDGSIVIQAADGPSTRMRTDGSTIERDSRDRITSIQERALDDVVRPQGSAVAERAERTESTSTATEKEEELNDATINLVQEKGEIGKAAFDAIVRDLRSGKIADAQQFIDQINTGLQETGSSMRLKMSLQHYVSKGLYGGTSTSRQSIQLIDKDEDTVAKSWRVSESHSYRTGINGKQVTESKYYEYDRQHSREELINSLIRARKAK